jgi:ubiquinone/menaquinone biosynthesis C-methylase UbiE
MTRYVISGGREGYERLRLLARVRWPETAQLFADVGVGPGLTCLDLGCGGGAVTMELAKLVGPSGRAVGIDMDEVKLELARADAAAGGFSNIEFRSADVGEWSEPEAYDVVYARFLLEHVPGPLDLLHRMWEAVRPGGALAVEDADFEGLFSDPPHAAFELWKRLNPEVLDLNGGDPWMGRKLHRLYLEAGIPDPEVRLTQTVSTSGEAKTLPAVTLAAMSDAILGAGLASEDELNGAIAGLEAYAADPTTLVAGPRVFQVWSRKPAERLTA